MAAHSLKFSCFVLVVVVGQFVIFINHSNAQKFEVKLANLQTKPYLLGSSSLNGNYGAWTYEGYNKNWSLSINYVKQLKKVAIVSGLGYMRESFIFSLTRFLDPVVGSIDQKVTYSGLCIPLLLRFNIPKPRWSIATGISMFKPMQVKRLMRAIVIDDFNGQPIGGGYYNWYYYHQKPKTVIQYFWETEASLGLNASNSLKAGVLLQVGLNQSNLIREAYVVKNRVYGEVGFAPVFNNLSFFCSYAF